MYTGEVQPVDALVVVACAVLLTDFARNVVDRVFEKYFSHSRELWLRTIRDSVAHMIFRHVPALRAANTCLRLDLRERLLVLRGVKVNN